MIDLAGLCHSIKQKEKRIKQMTNQIKSLTIKFSREKNIPKNIYKVGKNSDLITIEFKDNNLIQTFYTKYGFRYFSYENRDWFKDFFEKDLWLIFFNEIKL